MNQQQQCLGPTSYSPQTRTWRVTRVVSSYRSLADARAQGNRMHCFLQPHG